MADFPTKFTAVTDDDLGIGLCSKFRCNIWPIDLKVQQFEPRIIHFRSVGKLRILKT